MAGRNSDIDRAGMGTQVETMAASGDNPGMIAAAVSDESGHSISAASVRRHLAKHGVNAAVVLEEHLMAQRVAAAISGLADTRDTDVSSYFGKYQLNTSNPFTKFYGLARETGYGPVESAFEKIALKITRGARIVGREQDAEKIDALSKSIGFATLLADTTRYTFEMGTCLLGTKNDAGAWISPTGLSMQYYTLLTDSETVGTIGKDMVHGEITKIVFDETGDNPKTLERDEVGLLRRWSNFNEMKDIAGRSTDGIYGRSLTIGIETPLKSLLNGGYYYDEFIKRYGLGRLNINLKLLGEQIAAKEITSAEAQASQNAEAAAIKELNPNEDFIGAGREISMLESKTGFDIMPYRNDLKEEINRTLLQSDVAAGNVGSSWTSAGTAVSAQDYDIYQSSRDSIFEQFMTEIIAPRCEEFLLKPETLSIAATPFLRVDVPFADLNEMWQNGNITESELRDRGGFPAVKPDEN